MKYIGYIITFVAAVLITWAIIPTDHADKKILKDQIKTLLHERDSIIKRKDVLAGRDSLWSRTHASDRDSLLISRKETNHWQNEYKKIRSTPAVHYNEHATDSAIDALISPRLHKTP